MRTLLHLVLVLEQAFKWIPWLDEDRALKQFRCVATELGQTRREWKSPDFDGDTPVRWSHVMILQGVVSVFISAW